MPAGAAAYVVGRTWDSRASTPRDGGATTPDSAASRSTTEVATCRSGMAQ